MKTWRGGGERETQPRKKERENTAKG